LTAGPADHRLESGIAIILFGEALVTSCFRSMLGCSTWLYLFNNESGWSTLGRMGHIDELRTPVASGVVYGMIEDPAIDFLRQEVMSSARYHIRP
jgi:hypothetical protein